MKRRVLIRSSLGAAALAPLAARAQDRKRRIGVLISRPERDAEGQAYLAALRQGLVRLGWNPERAELEIRWFPADASEARAQLAGLVAWQPDVLVIGTSVYMRFARELAGNIPIVFVNVADPVGQGYVASLAQPGGTITGFGSEEASMGGKWLELLLEIAPRTERCLFVFNPATAASPDMFLAAAVPGAGARVERRAAPVANDAELERVVAEAGRARGRDGLIFPPDTFLFVRREALAALAARHAAPAVYFARGFVDAGGLASYGVDRIDTHRRAATYVHLVLNGARPGEMPVQMPTRFELVVNLRAARALGLTPPPALLGRADEVLD